MIVRWHTPGRDRMCGRAATRTGKAERKGAPNLLAQGPWRRADAPRGDWRHNVQVEPRMARFLHGRHGAPLPAPRYTADSPHIVLNYYFGSKW